MIQACTCLIEKVLQWRFFGDVKGKMAWKKRLKGVITIDEQLKKQRLLFFVLQIMLLKDIPLFE